MLGTPTDPYSPGAKLAARAKRERSLQVRVTLPAGGDSASRRLARKIQNSLSRTLAGEPGAMLDYTIVSGNEAPSPHSEAAAARPNATRHCAPGCGAWWNF